MNDFLKIAAGALTALILWLTLSKNAKDMSVLFTLAVCALIFTAAIAFLKPVLDFLGNIQMIAELDEELLSVILKVVGIGMIGEICILICKDAGNESIGKVLQILSSVVVLWMSIPVFEKLLSLLNKILGTI